MKAGFAQIDITPPPGTLKIGWLEELYGEVVLDPLFARIAVFDDGRNQIGFIQLDTLSIRWTTTREIRHRVEAAHGFPASRIMVSATHSHAGPAVATIGDSERDDAYVETMIEAIVRAFGEALEARRDAEVALGLKLEFGLTHNRRVMLRDGTTRTGSNFDHAEALCFEGPIDPEVGVLAVREAGGGAPLGLLVNFACHPLHHGPTDEISSGYPGALERAAREAGWPTTLFFNGACGNINPHNPFDPAGPAGRISKEELGGRLAADALSAIEGAAYERDAALAARATRVDLPYRRYTDPETRAEIKGAERFVDPAIYDREMPKLLRRIDERKVQPAEVQVLSVGGLDVVSIPAEFFVQLGLQIKEGAWPRRAWISSCSNGMVGYVPTKEAFERGGYETTFAMSSRLAPEAGDMLVEAAVSLVKK